MIEFEFPELSFEDALARIKLTTEVGFQHIFKLPYDYKPNSLSALDDNIKVRRLQSALINTTYLPFGFCLGQTVVLHIPGALWIDPEDKGNPFDFAIRVPCGETTTTIFFPMRAVQEFWEEEGASLQNCFEALQELSQNPPDSETMQKGGKITLAGEEWEMGEQEFLLKEQEEQFINKLKKHL